MAFVGEDVYLTEFLVGMPDLIPFAFLECQRQIIFQKFWERSTFFQN